MILSPACFECILTFICLSPSFPVRKAPQVEMPAHSAWPSEQSAVLGACPGPPCPRRSLTSTPKSSRPLCEPAARHSVWAPLSSATHPPCWWKAQCIYSPKQEKNTSLLAFQESYHLLDRAELPHSVSFINYFYFGELHACSFLKNYTALLISFWTRDHYLEITVTLHTNLHFPTFTCENKECRWPLMATGIHHTTNSQSPDHKGVFQETRKSFSKLNSRQHVSSTLFKKVSLHLTLLMNLAFLQGLSPCSIVLSNLWSHDDSFSAEKSVILKE